MSRARIRFNMKLLRTARLRRDVRQFAMPSTITQTDRGHAVVDAVVQQLKYVN